MSNIDDNNLELAKDLSIPGGMNGTDLETYRLSQDFESMAGVRKEILTVPVRKPDRQSFVWVHPGEDWRMPALIFELKEDRENYIVRPNLRDEFPGEFTPKYLFTAQTRQGTTFLWPVRMPGPDGRLDPWNQSALVIINEYSGKWIRVLSNRDSGSYEVVTPDNEFPPPVWPPEGFPSLVNKAFRGKIIDTLDHPVLKRLRGGI